MGSKQWLWTFFLVIDVVFLQSLITNHWISYDYHRLVKWDKWLKNYIPQSLTYDSIVITIYITSFINDYYHITLCTHVQVSCGHMCHLALSHRLPYVLINGCHMEHGNCFLITSVWLFFGINFDLYRQHDATWKPTINRHGHLWHIQVDQSMTTTYHIWNWNFSHILFIK